MYLVTSDESAERRFFKMPFVVLVPMGRKSSIILIVIGRERLSDLKIMDVSSYEQTHSEQLSKAMSQYENARQAYMQSLNAALDEQDPSQRASLLQGVVQQNQQLITIVQSIVSYIDSGSQELKDSAATTGKTLRDQLETYKKQSEAIQRHGDQIQKLRELLSQATEATKTAETYYFGYLIAILVLIALILVLFLFSKKGDADMGSSLPAGSISVPGTFSFSPTSTTA